MPISEVTNDDFFQSCLKHCEVDWEAVCKETDLTRNAAKKRWNRFMEKQGTADSTKTTKQPGTEEKGLKHGHDGEESLVEQTRKTKKKKCVKTKDKKAELTAEDDEEGETRA